MEFRYSHAVPRDTYATDGLSFGIPLPNHSDPHREDRGALSAQKDWNSQVGPLIGYQGGLGSRVNFIGVTVPECLPERLEILSYVNEFAFLYDREPPSRSARSTRY